MFDDSDMVEQGGWTFSHNTIGPLGTFQLVIHWCLYDARWFLRDTIWVDYQRKFAETFLIIEQMRKIYLFISSQKIFILFISKPSSIVNQRNDLGTERHVHAHTNTHQIICTYFLPSSTNNMLEKFSVTFPSNIGQGQYGIFN